MKICKHEASAISSQHFPVHLNLMDCIIQNNGENLYDKNSLIDDFHSPSQTLESSESGSSVPFNVFPNIF